MDRITNSRLLRIVAVLFTVSVVMFSNPLAAQAATSGVNRYSFQGFEVKGAGVGFADCQVSWSTIAATGYIVVSSKSRCDGGPDATPGTCQAFEAGCGSYGWVVKDSGGQTCGSAGLDAVSADGDGLRAIRTNLVAKNTVNLVDREDCLPAEACLSYYWDGFGPGANDQVQCSPISVDGPDVDTPEECEFGEPSGQPIVKIEAVPSSSGGNWKFDTVAPVAAVDLHQTGGSDWVFYVVTTNADFPQRLEKDFTGRMLGINSTAKQKWGNGTLTWVERMYLDSEYNGTPPADRLTVEGFGLYRTGWDNSANTDHIPQADVIGPQVGKVGLTNPGQCMWYWGKKIAPPQADGSDNPVDNPDVQPPPEPPDPETPDPESDNWLYLIWKMLGNIWEAIKNLASTIANAIADALSGIVDAVVDGIKDLFVPDDGFFDAQFARLDDSYSDTSPAQYVDAIEQLVPSAGAAGGCSGPTVTLPIAGTTRTFEPLDACGGGMATAATMSRLLGTVAVLVFGALACVRALGSGLGWNPSIGKPGDQ